MERIAESRRASTESVRRERERSAPLNPPQHNRLTFPTPPVTQQPDRAPVVPAPRPIGPPAPRRFPTPPTTPACAISRGLAPSSLPATPCSMPRRRGPYRRSPSTSRTRDPLSARFQHPLGNYRSPSPRTGDRTPSPGYNSFSPPFARGPLAQLAEQLTLNQPVPGSSPGGLTSKSSSNSERPFRSERPVFAFDPLFDPLSPQSSGSGRPTGRT